MTPETTNYSIAVALMEQRIREAEQARLSRSVRRDARGESRARRWVRSLVRGRPAAADPVPVGPIPEAPVEDPWREAA